MVLGADVDVVVGIGVGGSVGHHHFGVGARLVEGLGVLLAEGGAMPEHGVVDRAVLARGREAAGAHGEVHRRHRVGDDGAVHHLGTGGEAHAARRVVVDAAVVDRGGTVYPHAATLVVVAAAVARHVVEDAAVAYGRLGAGAALVHIDGTAARAVVADEVALRDDEGTLGGIGVAAAARHVGDEHAAAPAVVRRVFACGMAAGNDEAGEERGQAIVVGIVFGGTNVHGEDMGGVVAACGVLGVYEQGIGGAVVVLYVAEEHRLVLHVVLLLVGDAAVHGCLVALETSIHGNARRQDEACLRGGITVPLRGRVVTLHPYLVARLRLGEGGGEGDGSVPRRTVVGRICGGFCRDMIYLALRHYMCRGAKHEEGHYTE